MKIKEYIESGILEAYVVGSASAEETQQLLALRKKHPEVAYALNELELDLERIAEHMAIAPPPGMLEKIEDSIGELIRQERSNRMPAWADPLTDQQSYTNDKPENQFIEVEGSSSHMRIHKAWRWVFAAVFVLGKIFLGFAIYYYLESRQAIKEIQKLEHQQEILKKQQ